MKSFFRQIIIKIVKDRYKPDDQQFKRKLLEEVKLLEVSVSHIFSDIFFIFIGVISAGFGF